MHPSTPRSKHPKPTPGFTRPTPTQLPLPSPSPSPSPSRSPPPSPAHSLPRTPPSKRWWTAEEDAQLRALVEEEGARNWRKIAGCFA